MNLRLFISLIIASTSLGFLNTGDVWKKDGAGIYESDIRIIKIDPEDDNTIYVGTSRNLYQSIDKGNNYRVILSPSGESSGVNDIYIELNQSGIIYAATDAGLYQSKNKGGSWHKIYDSSDVWSRKCLSIHRNREKIYLGTQKGLYAKQDNETHWKRVKGEIDDLPIYHIIENEKFLYMSSGQSVFILDKQNNRITRIFSMGIGERSIEDGEVIQNTLDNQYIKFIEHSNVPYGYVFIATTKGIYFSRSPMKKWNKLTVNNLAVKDITSLLIVNNKTKGTVDCSENLSKCMKIFAGTMKGVFLLENKKWIPLYKGMSTNAISYLAKNKRETVYAATTKGVYFLSDEKALPSLHEPQDNKFTTPPKTKTDSRGQARFSNEPSISEVHKMAIDYAEVNQDKILNWRTLARKKALLPDLSVGLDRNGSDLFHWNTGASPDELQKGRDYVDWDISMSWDLSDFIWSTDQTTIDSRSKLMVELRDDILNEVTRLYFERRRIQAELTTDLTYVDDRMKFDWEMRIAELTALIDALTGGQFSERIIKNK